MSGGDSGDRPERPDRPDYTVYRSRPRLRDRFGKPDLEGLRERLRRGVGRGEKKEAPETERPLWRRVAKWVGIAALAWILLSFLAFAVSAQLQKFKLADGAADALDGNPFMLVSPQNILVLGTDIRSGAFAGPEEAASKKCLEAAGEGRTAPEGCAGVRSDTIMVVRAGRGTFRKLSIPRDTLAEIPGRGADKINAAYAFGGAKLTIRTVENFLGIDIDQLAIVDFDGFRNFIDSLGGIEVDLPTDVCSNVSNGAFNLNLDAGEHTLNGFEAITLARTRANSCGTGQFTGSDLERAQFQQVIIDGIKGRLTSITRLPYNFIKGPIIGWNAPKAFVSSMGALTMPQLVLSAAIGGSGSEVLQPQSLSDPLIIPQEECQRKVEEVLGGDPPRQPACSPGG
ncbi:MAG TPA: LCP family protein [Solirubrobacterales bacterium]|nr:LCP family protein [Solirubrobacterales bacterium]